MTWKKIWYFLWKDDSLASWVVNVILAFLIIKFIVYPGLGLLLGTPFPIVAVVSGSMEHDINKEYAQLGIQESERYEMCGHSYLEDRHVNFDVYWQECGGWYENINISKEEFRDYPLHNGFNKGDIIVLYSKKNIEQGDVIVFWGNHPEPIIHRIVQENAQGYITKGDHNAISDQGITANQQVVGKALFKIPLLGWVKILFVEFLGLFGG